MGKSTTRIVGVGSLKDNMILRVAATLIFMTLLTSNVYSQVQYPYEVLTSTDTDLQGLEWNRYTTKNFVILSIDDAQGLWLSQNIESIKKWCLTRWGFPEENRKSAIECRVFCVPDKALMKKLFDIESSKVEIRQDLIVMWLILDEKPTKTIPPYLTQVCLAQYEEAHHVKVGFWFKRGSALLNGTTAEIRHHLNKLAKTVQEDHSLFTSERMFSFTEEDYAKETAENKAIFDQESVALCLLLRKEFGEAKLQGLLRMSSRNDPQDVLRVIYGFSGYNHFDKQYIRFMKDLSSEIRQEKVPVTYLDIKAVR